MADFELAASSFITEYQQPGDRANGLHQSNLSQTECVSRIKEFKKQLGSLVFKLPFQDEALVKREPSETKEISAKHIPAPRHDRLALTLQERGPRGRQLFSSLGLNDDFTKPMNEATLPEGLSTTKIIPFNTSTFGEPKSKTKTIGEVFTPRSNLPPLDSPQKHKPTLSGSSVVTWLDPLDILAANLDIPPARRYYSSTSLPSGSWISYGYESPSRSTQPTQNNQDRSVTHGSQKTPDTLDEQKMSYTAVYSSFAPTFDSSSSIVPRNIKYQAWWKKSGETRMRDLIMSSEEENKNCESLEAQSSYPEPLNDATLKEAVEAFKPEEDMEDVTGSNSRKPDDAPDRDAEDILNDISDLLQTLSSYREIRHLSQPTAPVSQVNGLSANRELTDKPSDAEFSIYEMLKSSLSIMVADLPPYLVSKLSGDQLSELNLSKKVMLDQVDYSGTMEEDEYTRQQKQIAHSQKAAATPRVPPPNPTQARPGTYQVPSSNMYQRPAPATRVKPVPGNYQAPQAYPSRQSLPATQYQPANVPQPYTPSSQPAQRQGYAQPQFSHPTAASPYSRSGMLQQFQRSTPNGSTPYAAARGPSPAQTANPAYTQRVPQPNYQQRMQDNATNSPHTRNISAQKPPNFNHSTQQPPYMASPSPGPQPRYFQQQTPQANYPGFSSNQSSPMPAPYPKTTAASMAYSRSAAEQTAIMDRNKLQLTDSRRQSSGTPQPFQTNGQTPVRETIELQGNSHSATPMSTGSPSKG